MDKYQTTLTTFNDVAEVYWHKFKDFELYLPTYDWFLERIQSDLETNIIELLEIACGPGNVSLYLLDKNPSINLFGIDLAPNMIDLARLNNPKALYQVMDCRNINSIDGSFDAIMCGFCIPYLSSDDSQKLIQDMALMLNAGGILYLSTTEGEKANEGFRASKSTAGAIYVHYHDIDKIQLGLKKAGLDIIGVKRLTHIHNQQATDDVFFLARKPS